MRAKLEGVVVAPGAVQAHNVSITPVLTRDDFDEPGGILRIYHSPHTELRVHLRFPRAVAS